MNRLAIIILNWNATEDTIECLHSLEKVEYKDLKIFVLDNGSKKDELNKLEFFVQDKSNIRLIKSEINLGFTRGNNFVLEKLLNENSFDYFVLLNNDTVVDKNWLENLLICSVQEEAGIVTSKLIKYNDKSEIDNVGLAFLNTGEIVPIGEFDNIERYQTRQQIIAPSGAACLVKREIVEKLGLFDKFFNTGYEDAEFGLRASIAGYKVFFEPTAIVYHKGSVSVDKIRNDSYVLKLFTNIWYAYFKLTPMLTIFLNFPIMLFKIFGYTGIFLIKPKISINFFKSIYEIFKLRRVVWKARKEFNPNRKLGSVELWRKQKSFIPFYWKYLRMVMNKNNNIDKKLN